MMDEAMYMGNELEEGLDGVVEDEEEEGEDGLPPNMHVEEDDEVAPLETESE